MKRIEFQLFKLEGPRWKERLIKSFHISEELVRFLPGEKFISFKILRFWYNKVLYILIEYLKISFYQRQRENVIIRTKLPDKSPMMPISGQYSGFDRFFRSFITLYRNYVTKIFRKKCRKNEYRYEAFTGRTIENRIYDCSGKRMMIENDQIDR